MAEIKTIIQLRNDTTENWSTEAGQATKLVPGEVAIEITEDGKAKMKIGTKDDETFAEAQYFGSDPAKVFQSEDLAYNNAESDEEVIVRLVADTELNNGDCAIIKRQVADGSGSYIYTSYVYTDGVWAAMDGNYDANNVYFKNDILLAGSYEQVGNISKAVTETKTLEAAGKSLADVMQTIFTKEINTDLKKSDPGASISSFTQYYEIGKGGTKSATVSLSDGEYTYGYSTNPTEPTEGQTVTAVLNDTTTGVVVDTSKTNPYSVTYSDGSTSEGTSATFTLTAPVKNDKAELKVKGSVYHTKGGVPVSNLKKAYPGQRIAAGQKTSGESAVFRWYVPFYQGFTFSDSVIADPENITAEQLTTGLTAPVAKTSDGKVSSTSTAVKNVDSTAYNKTKCTVAVAPKAWRQYFLAYPTSYSYDMSAAKDGNGIDCTVNKAKEVELDINGNKVNYTVYYINNAADYDTLSISWTLN